MLWLPDMDDMLMPTMLVVPTQLLAYYTAVGADVMLTSRGILPRA